MNMNAHTILYTLRRKWKLTRVATQLTRPSSLFFYKKRVSSEKSIDSYPYISFTMRTKKKESFTSGNLATKIKLLRRQRRKATIRACKQIYNIVCSFLELKALKALYILSYLLFRKTKFYLFLFSFIFSIIFKLYEIN